MLNRGTDSRDGTPGSLKQVVGWAIDEAIRRASEPSSHASDADRRALGGTPTFAAVDSFQLPQLPAGDDAGVFVVVLQRTDRSIVSRTQLENRFGLTRRESEVAFAMADRVPSPEIAVALGISPNTARRHCERVLMKLGVRSRRDVRAIVYPCERSERAV